MGRHLPRQQPTSPPREITGLIVLANNNTLSTTRRGISSRLSESPIEDDSKITTQLIDIISKGPPFIIGQQVLLVNSQRQQKFPVVFKVPYYPDQIRADRIYALQCTIMSSARRLDFVSAHQVPVLTRGGPVDRVTVTLQRV